MSKFEEYVIAPGETIVELLEANCMTQLDLAAKMGITKKNINEIIKGKAPITNSTALKLEYIFKIPASFWNNLESSYRDSLERQKDRESIIEDEKYLLNIPYSEMAKRNWDWIEKTRDSYEKVINLRKFFSVASLGFDTELKRRLAFRKSDNKNFSYDSLYCWLRYGEIQANKEEYPKFNIDLLKENTYKIRMLVNKPFLDVLDKVKELLKECGVALIYESHLPNTYVNGVTYKITCDKAIIMISDRGKRDDSLWFTLFHELGHLIKHSKKEVFLDLDDTEVTDIEKEANDFAKNVLIPNVLYNKFINSNKFITEQSIIDFSKEIDVSTGIIVGRLQSDNKIEWNKYNNLITRI